MGGGGEGTEGFAAPGPWERHINWRRWCGWDLRRRIYATLGHDGREWWQYGRSKKVAREMLDRAYGQPQPDWTIRA